MEQLAIGGISVVFVIIFVSLGFISGMAKMEKEAEKFRKTFVTQRVIDEMLRKLAQNLDDAYTAETELLRSLTSVKEREERADDLQRVKTLIQDRKNLFWQAVEVAKNNGYKTPTKVHEALKVAA